MPTTTHSCLTNQHVAEHLHLVKICGLSHVYTIYNHQYNHIIPYPNNLPMPLQRACLQPATNTQNSKSRPPSPNNKHKKEMEN